MMRDILILGGARTPFAVWSGGKTGDGKPGGALKSLDPFDLGAVALRGALDRSRVRSGDLDQVVFANMYQVGPHACYGARYAALRAGIPDFVPGLTVSMACGSGLYALMVAASAVRDGASLAAAAGADSSSLIPRSVFIPSFTDLACGRSIGGTVDALAREYSVTRKDQDAWALRSHRSAALARKEGRLAEEIVEAGGRREDDAVSPEPAAALRAAEPIAGKGGTVTRMNSHAVVDGGAALILASTEGARRTGGAPWGRWLSGACAATAPARMGVASVPAVRRALESARLSIGEIDLFEINETFAAQVLIDLKELGVPEERVNVNGGAVALGHPFAATGGRQVLALLLELRRRGLRRGAAAICVGGGQGIAAVVETV